SAGSKFPRRRSSRCSTSARGRRADGARDAHGVRTLRGGPGAGRRRAHLLLRVHVLPVVRRRDGLRVPELRRRARRAAEAGDSVTSGARHLYVHLPFCAHRCGYCDFVTATGRDHMHGVYVDALLRELHEEHDGSRFETLFLGGGTPTYTALPELLRLLRALPSTHELTVEAN